MTIIGIFLDDERTPSDVTWVLYPSPVSWQVVNNAADFFEAVKRMGDAVTDCEFSFDHDIQSYTPSGNELTGYDCVKFLVDYCMDNQYPLPANVHFHTQNPVGKENMKRYYENAYWHTRHHTTLVKE